MDFAFRPCGKSYLVTDAASVQVLGANNVANLSYRVRNTTAAAASFSWLPPIANNAAVIVPTVTAPIAGTPSANTISMATGSVEIFTLPANAWFLASAAGTFEIMTGLVN